MSGIIPTVFATSKKEFNERFEKLREISENIQIDFMDGKFVKSKSVSVSNIPDLNRYLNNFEAHLMVKSPGKYLTKLKAKGFSKVIFHYESLSEVQAAKFVGDAKRKEFTVFIAINPGTALGFISSFLETVDGVLFMGVEPGREHQKIVPKVYSKIRELRDINQEITIQVDGGVNDKTAKMLGESGANLLNSGSFVTESPDPKKALKKLEKLFNVG